MTKISDSKQKIWDEYQPKLQELNTRRHQTNNKEEFCRTYTELVNKRNEKINAVQ